MRIVTAGFAAIWLMVMPLAAQEAGRLKVVGHGSVDTVPDMATISLGVTNEARTAGAALAANSAATGQMLQEIAQAGIEPRDMQTSGLSLSPRWSNRSSNNNARPAIVGFSASNQVTIRVRDIDRLGGILDAVVQNGANQFHGLSFGLQDPVPTTDLAREAAVKDAIRKARLYAAAAGLELGAILELSEAGVSSPRPVMVREMALSADVPIAQGEVSLGASVTIIFQISP